MSEHTPTPWAIRSDDGCIHEATDRWDLIPLISPWREGAFEAGHAAAEANMAFIVKAVNNHDFLVKALTELLDICESMGEFRSGVVENCVDEGQVYAGKLIDQARDALTCVEISGDTP